MKLVTNTPNDNCPCKNCVNRFVGCHSSCVLYIDWKQVNEVRLKLQHKDAESRNLYWEGETRRNKQLRQKGVSFGRNKRDNDTR